MDKKRLQIIFFFLILFGVSISTYFLFEPFLSVLAVAAVFAVALQPLYRKILSVVKKESLAAFIVIIVASFFIILPVSFIGFQIFQEARGMYVHIQKTDINTFQDITKIIETPIRQFLPEFSLNLKEYFAKTFKVIAENAGSVVSGTVQLIISITLSIIALFFFLKDGHILAKSIIRLSPLEDSYDREIFRKVGATIGAVMKGALFIAIIQGFLAAIGLALFGVPNATLWGSLSAVAALVPGLGTTLVLIPAVIYLLIVGKTMSAIGLLIWGVVVVGLVDNFLTPRFYGKGVKVHQLFVLFSVLGGLSLFGPLGFVFGPMVLSLFLALIDIYRHLILGERITKSKTS